MYRIVDDHISQISPYLYFLHTDLQQKKCMCKIQVKTQENVEKLNKKYKKELQNSKL